MESGEGEGDWELNEVEESRGDGVVHCCTRG